MKPETKNEISRPEWYKISAHFKDAPQCNEFSMQLAVRLRQRSYGVYFARYSSAIACRTDYYVKQANLDALRILLRQLRAKLRGKHIRLMAPAGCAGSDAHAAGFDCACAIIKTLGASHQQLLLDVTHWMANMCSIDYVDEARLNLIGVDRILKIFDECIKSGAKINKAN